jgi:beta-glucosidase
MKFKKLSMLLYSRFQAAQKGIVSLNLYTMWLYPFTDSAKDIEANERAKTFLYGWYVLLQ